MDTSELLIEGYTRIGELVHQATRDLSPDQLRYRPEPGSNSIAWLVWHLTRIQDDHLSAIAETPQVWTSTSWAHEFGLRADASNLGQGDGPAEVAAIRPDGPGVLVGYFDEVIERSFALLESIDPTELDRVIDRSYSPPVTVGVRLVSVLSDNLQHAGQARYLRGLIERTSSH